MGHGSTPSDPWPIDPFPALLLRPRSNFDTGDSQVVLPSRRCCSAWRQSRRCAERSSSVEWFLWRPGSRYRTWRSSNVARRSSETYMAVTHSYRGDWEKRGEGGDTRIASSVVSYQSYIIIIIIIIITLFCRITKDKRHEHAKRPPKLQSPYRTTT